MMHTHKSVKAAQCSTSQRKRQHKAAESNESSRIRRQQFKPAKAFLWQRKQLMSIMPAKATQVRAMQHKPAKSSKSSRIQQQQFKSAKAFLWQRKQLMSVMLPKAAQVCAMQHKLAKAV
jgi:hypothetical protein